MAAILTLMGSGETSPTMVKVHRSVLGRLGPAPVPAVLFATPFGFQENARELAGRISTYFRRSLGSSIEVAMDPGTGVGASTPEAEPHAAELFTAMLRDARYLFSGPGSPSYALRQWRGGIVPGLLREKLTKGGAVTFASAAALTLGAFTVPVYEIYKVGEDPHWLEGLDVLGAIGLHCAMVPHYNNAEGGTHDTRFCYLGERRLEMMEALLPDDHFVLGVDEHTALIVDTEARSVTIDGIGLVTVRRHGRSTSFASGDEIGLDELIGAAFYEPVGDLPLPEAPEAARNTSSAPGSVASAPLLDLVRAQEAAFASSLAAFDVDAAVEAVLVLERHVLDWSTDVPQQDELDRARASLRAMIVELGALAREGLRDPRTLVGPYVEVLLELRARARNEGRFAEADLVRERLSMVGVEVRDGPDGTKWRLSDEAQAAARDEGPR